MTRRALVAGVALALLAGLALPVTAFKRARSKYGRPVHWPAELLLVKVKGLPEPVNSDAGWRVVSESVERWRAVKACRLPLLAFPRPAEAYDKRVGTITVDTPEVWPRKASETAWTDVISHPDTGAIERVTILLNKDIAWDVADPVAPDRVDLGSVITHELGHALGLAHSYARTSLMRAGIHAGERRRELTDDDVTGVCAVFGD